MIKDKKRFISRDLSWLSFNGRVLQEAAKPLVPLLERLKFLAIYSSNLDEFYRVRIPVLMALKELKKQRVFTKGLIKKGILKQAKKTIDKQQTYFGQVLEHHIIAALKTEQVYLLYCEKIPDQLKQATQHYFYCHIAAYITIVYPAKQPFFPKNNQLYLAVTRSTTRQHELAILNIPSEIARFFSVCVDDKQYVIFIDDIIKDNLVYIFPNQDIQAYTFKVTRDAELDLEDEFRGDMATEIEKQLNLRELGIATRFLYEPGIPEDVRHNLSALLQLTHANHMMGGPYHNLSDFFHFPISNNQLTYPKFATQHRPITHHLFESISSSDILIHTPYHSYDTVLGFFNEAAISPETTAIYTTMYRVAPDSRIMHALITAAKNGKSVQVFVELKARFDEANNIKWAKMMEAAGVRIIYSTAKLKVHAKIALVSRQEIRGLTHFALLSTGNLNERTAKTYTDHTLLTADTQLTTELHALFTYLKSDAFGKTYPSIPFRQLLVAQFNLLAAFTQLIDQEIKHALQGLPAAITIKLNNLEEEGLIDKLYEASQAGVKIKLIVRSICRIRPGVVGLSENIEVIRIVDRFLEHGRIFIFHDKGNEKVFLGSADWMERNIHRRIEVCFPIHNPTLKQEMVQIVQLQLSDDVAAVRLDKNGQNIKIKTVKQIRSQWMIQALLYPKTSTS